MHQEVFSIPKNTALSDASGFMSIVLDDSATVVGRVRAFPYPNVHFFWGTLVEMYIQQWPDDPTPEWHFDSIPAASHPRCARLPGKDNGAELHDGGVPGVFERGGGRRGCPHRGHAADVEGRRVARELQLWDMERSMRVWKAVADNPMVHAQGIQLVLSFQTAAVGAVPGAPARLHGLIDDEVICKNNSKNRDCITCMINLLHKLRFHFGSFLFFPLVFGT